MASRIKLSAFAVQALVAVLIGACASGGGGGGGSSMSPPPPPPVGPPPPSPPPPPPVDFPDITGAEFNANWGPGGVNAQVAWQHGATGEGVLVGVIDDGVHPDHPELSGQISSASIDIVAGRHSLVTDQSHGSEVATLIVGNHNDSQTVGVAFGATVLAVRADDDAGFFWDSDLAAAIDYARLQGADVINMSLGGEDLVSQELQDAIQRATQAGVILVFSAGNSGNAGVTHPDYPGFLATDPSISNGLILIAGGLNSDGTLNSASNPPSSAANWYLTAPGWQIIVPDFGPAGPVPGFQTCGLGPNGDLCRIQGTSFASPHVAAAVALVMEAFPGLSPAQVVDLLLTTADDTGATGTDALNGRGRLNIGRAFQPVGPLSIPLGDGQNITMATPLGVSGAAFGDGFTQSGAWALVGFDHYQRTFAADVGGNWIDQARGPAPLIEAPLLWRSEELAPGVRMQMAAAEDIGPQSYRLPIDRADLERAPMRLEFEFTPRLSVAYATHGAHTTYRGSDGVGLSGVLRPETSLEVTGRVMDGLSLSVATEFSDETDVSAISTMDLLRTPNRRSAVRTRAEFEFGASAFAVEAGRMHEDRGLLGLMWSDELGATPAGETQFARGDWSYEPTPDWRINMSAEQGRADLSQAGWLRVETPLRTTAFSMDIEHSMAPRWLRELVDGGEGAFTFSLSQPLRVESGALSFMAPTATKFGRRSLSYVRRTFEPAPSGRELRVGLGYRYFAGETVTAFGEALYVDDPGHVEAAAPEEVLRFGLRVAH